MKKMEERDVDDDVESILIFNKPNLAIQIYAQCVTGSCEVERGS